MKLELYNFEVLIRHQTEDRTMYLPVVASDAEHACIMVEGALGDDEDFQWRLDDSREAHNKGAVTLIPQWRCWKCEGMNPISRKTCRHCGVRREAYASEGKINPNKVPKVPHV